MSSHGWLKYLAGAFKLSSHYCLHNFAELSCEKTHLELSKTSNHFARDRNNRTAIILDCVYIKWIFGVIGKFIIISSKLIIYSLLWPAHLKMRRVESTMISWGYCLPYLSLSQSGTSISCGNTSQISWDPMYCTHNLKSFTLDNLFHLPVWRTSLLPNLLPHSPNMHEYKFLHLLGAIVLNIWQ